jgi:hypothetical protein
MATDPQTLEQEPHEPAPRSRAPGWLAEVVEVLELRRGVLVTTAFGLSLLGVLTALALPGVLPPRPLVGAAVGLAAVLLAIAVALGVDSVDLVIRGPRHVRASGGRLAAQLAGPPDADAAASLAAAVERRVDDGRTRIALTPASATDDQDVAGWADALARALAVRGPRVLLVDLTPQREERPGVADVAAGSCRLAEAVDFDHELMLASVGPGRSRREALDGLTELAVRLPSDIEVLVVALPHLGEPGVLAGAAALDRVLVVVEADETPRVDLIAALDALDATAAGSEVVLLDPVDRPMVTAWELVAASVPPIPAASTAPAAMDVPSVLEDVPLDTGGSTDRPEDDGVSAPHEDAPETPTAAAEDDPTGTTEEVADEQDEPADLPAVDDADVAPDQPLARPPLVAEETPDDDTEGPTLAVPSDTQADEPPEEGAATHEDRRAVGDPDDPADEEAIGDAGGETGDEQARDIEADTGDEEGRAVAAADMPDARGADTEPDPDDEPSDDGLLSAAALATFAAEHAEEVQEAEEAEGRAGEDVTEPDWEARAREPEPIDADGGQDPFANERGSDDEDLGDPTDRLEPITPFSHDDEQRAEGADPVGGGETDGDAGAPTTQHEPVAPFSRDEEERAEDPADAGAADDGPPAVIDLADDDPFGAEPPAGPGRDTDAGWSFPHEGDRPDRPADPDASPFEDEPDLDDDPLRVAAALQTLAHEVWSRDEDRD